MGWETVEGRHEYKTRQCGSLLPYSHALRELFDVMVSGTDKSHSCHQSLVPGQGEDFHDA